MSTKSRSAFWMGTALLVIALVTAACAQTATPSATAPSASATPTSPAAQSPTDTPVAATNTPLPPGPTMASPTDAPVPPTPAPPPPTEAPTEVVLVPPDMPSAVRGEPIYESNCVRCHGEAGDGSGLPGAADFTDVTFMRDQTPASLFVSIRDGVEGSAMPVYGGQLSEQEMWDVLYRVWAFATSPSRVSEGEELFASNCATCHGSAGDGSGRPGAADFTDQSFMSQNAPRDFFASVRDGVQGSVMPAWGGQFEEDQMWSLVDYIWTFAYVYEDNPLSEPTATATPSLPTTPSAGVGERVWAEKPCMGCHGAQAGGGVGPRLAGTGLTYDQVLLTARSGSAPMPAFSPEEVSDLEVSHIHAWLQSLAPPTPTPIAQPAFPTAALMAMWQNVNDMKVRSDFAKDLPERQAGDDAGRLAILRQYANDALQLGQSAIQQANQALSEIPRESVQASIRQVIDETSKVIDQANQALAQSSFDAAYPHAAEMVYICRLDAWPLATQAVRDAGLSGTVQVRVTDQAGNPISGALVTVLTAHTPLGARTDSAGRVTLVNVAAVPALQVKAYDSGLVYHEVHVNLSPGATAGSTIALPGPSVGGQTPSVANPSIEPATGPGDARVTLQVTATDPQGASNLAEDQIFALNPNIGLAYILRRTGGNQYATTITLPGLAAGPHTWYFFAVDHQCNTSTIIPVEYTVQ